MNHKSLNSKHLVQWFIHDWNIEMKYNNEIIANTDALYNGFYRHNQYQSGFYVSIELIKITRYCWKDKMFQGSTNILE